ncbi:MAG: hypothetical protein IKV37_06475, partial [Prevotella sp.]|nr:hypothetical protein [Prevotella sp.]
LFLRPNEYSYKRAYVEEHIGDIRYLLLGNSHIVHSLKPDILGDGVFNMAIESRHLVYDVELAKRYVPQMDQLELLIIPLGYGRFYFGRGTKYNPRDTKNNRERKETTHKCMYYKYMDIRVDGFWYWSELLNSKLDYMKRFLKNDKDARACDSLGYVELHLKRNDRWSNWSLPKIVDMTIVANRKSQDLLYERFCTLAELAKNQGAKLIILVTPKYKTYNNSKNPVVMKEMESFMASLKQKYSNVECYDYSTDKRFVDEDFYDSHHLNDIGANKFSNIVKEEIFDKHQ